MEILLEPQFHALFAEPEIDPEGQGYQALQHALARSREKNEKIRFSYLIREQNGKYFFIMDSEPESSPDASPYGEEYLGPADSIRKVITTGLTVVSGFETDRWGTWVSAITPVLDQSGAVAAVLGFDYPADVWQRGIYQRMTPDVLIVSSLALLLIALFWVIPERWRLARLSKMLAADERLFRAVVDQAPIGIVVNAIDNPSSGIKFSRNNVNRMFSQIVGRSAAELEGLGWLDITHPDDREATLDSHQRLCAGEIDGFTLVKRYVRPDGTVVWANAKAIRISGGDSERYMLALIEDITARKQAEDALRESERSKAVLLSHVPGLAYRCLNDREWTMEFVSEGCMALTGYPPESFLYNRERSYGEIIAPEYRDALWDEWRRVLSLRTNFRYEYEIITRDDGRKWVLELGQGIYDENGVQALEGIIIDISSQKDNEARILFMSEHDSMTGLNNRRYYERIRGEMEAGGRLPLSVAVCDIDGLHLINDVFGLKEGDRLIVETAKLLKRCVRAGDVLIRSGGDEFTLIMPGTSSAGAEQMNRRIKDAVSAFNQSGEHLPYELSLSVGCSTRVSAPVSFTMTVKEAQENMHYHKLLESRSPHSAILLSVMATMLARSRETEAHGERLVSLSRAMGESLGLQQKEMDELELYAMLHDIGKVGVDDRILNKPGKLTGEEWEQMKKHSEIGYRIAASTSELAHVADYILSHHERWDGGGYPRGISGEQIPLLSRLLSIVDAYDAMTEDRVYRRALSSEEALQEIERGSGTQFDPALAVRFIRMIRG